jgi:hypothetical protein
MLLNHGACTMAHGYDGYAQGQKMPTLLQVLDLVAHANSDPVRVDQTARNGLALLGGGYSIVQLIVTQASR